MNVGAALLLACFAVVAPLNWLTRRPGSERFEAPTKLGAIALLIAAAIVLTPDDGAVRAWFVIALVLSAAGDALLLDDHHFIAGLAAFLLAHVAYIVGFVLIDAWRPLGLLTGAVGALVVAATVGRPILRAARASDPALGIAVACYLVTILTMLTVGAATLPPVGVAGAALFVVSDALLGWRTFVVADRTPTWMHPAIMASYHLAQVLLVVSLTVM